MDNVTADDLLGVWECLRARWDRDECVERLAAWEPDADTLRAVAERAWDLADVAINEHRPELREISAGGRRGWTPTSTGGAWLRSARSGI